MLLISAEYFGASKTALNVAIINFRHTDMGVWICITQIPPVFTLVVVGNASRLVA
jgi:hypothetical protein